MSFYIGISSLSQRIHAISIEIWDWQPIGAGGKVSFFNMLNKAFSNDFSPHTVQVTSKFMVNSYECAHISQVQTASEMTVKQHLTLPTSMLTLSWALFLFVLIKSGLPKTQAKTDISYIILGCQHMDLYAGVLQMQVVWWPFKKN